MAKAKGGKKPFGGFSISFKGCDDSVAGVRYDLAMEGDDSSGWSIVAATRQDICRRGEGGGELCV